MLLAGSDDGVCRFESADETAESASTKVFDSGASSGSGRSMC
jgi:hypothetical protein